MGSKKAAFGFSAIILACGLVANYEGLVLSRYADPVGIPTICFGETDKDVVRFGALNRHQCTVVLGASLAEHARAVAPCITREIKPYEAAAVLSWSYNVGAVAACKSTLVKKLNANQEWCSELKRWDKAGGQVLKGLTKRRAAEYQMCTTGKWEP
jgi:lysozyme